MTATHFGVGACWRDKWMASDDRHLTQQKSSKKNVRVSGLEFGKSRRKETHRLPNILRALHQKEGSKRKEEKGWHVTSSVTWLDFICNSCSSVFGAPFSAATAILEWLSWVFHLQREKWRKNEEIEKGKNTKSKRMRATRRYLLYLYSYPIAARGSTIVSPHAVSCGWKTIVWCIASLAPAK